MRRCLGSKERRGQGEHRRRLSGQAFRSDPYCKAQSRWGLSSLGSSSPDPFSDESRSEEHTSELQSLAYLVCRLLLEKKKKLCYSSLKQTITIVNTLASHHPYRTP